MLLLLDILILQRTSSLLSLCRGVQWKSALNSGTCHTASCSTSLVCLILVLATNIWAFVTYFVVNGNPNLPLLPYSPQHMLRNTHSYMQFSAHTNYFQHYGTPYLLILLLHQLFLFLRIIFISYSFFMGACITLVYCHYSCVFPLCIKFHS